MDNKYFETMEECKKDIENGAEVLIENPIYSSKTGKITMCHSLIKKDGKYANIIYHKYTGIEREKSGKWCANYKNPNIQEYQNAETFIVSLCKSFFEEEHKRIVGLRM